MLRRNSVARFQFILCFFVIFSSMIISCATSRDVTDLRYEMKAWSDATESRLYSIKQSIASLDSIVKEQQSISLSIRALMRSQAQEQRDNIESLAARQDEINYQIRELLNKLQAIQLYGGITPDKTEEKPNASSSSTKTTPARDKTLVIKTPSATIEVKPEELYKSAINDITNVNYAFAESRLLTFLLQFPDHELSGNAQYWLGEIAYSQQRYELAINEFDKVLKKYPKSPKIPLTLLKKGLSQIETGHKKSSRSTLKKLINSFPKSEEAKIAREKLESL